MAYTRLNLNDGDTVYATHVSHVEDGIEDCESQCSELKDSLTELNDGNFRVEYGLISPGNSKSFNADQSMLLVIQYSSANYGLYSCYSNRMDVLAAGENLSFEVVAEGNNVYTFYNNHTTSRIRYTAFICSSI